MGLRLKLGVYVVALVSAVVALYGVITLHEEEAIFLQEMKQRGEALLRSFAIPCAVAMANNDTPALDNYVVKFAEAATDLDLSYMAVLDFSGRVASHTSTEEFSKLYDDPFTRLAMSAEDPVSQIVEAQGLRLLEIAVPVESGLRWGTLKAGFTLVRMENNIAGRRKGLFTLALTVGLISGALAFSWLSRSVIRPVLRMTDMARRFGAGRLDARVDSPQRDEMGQLAVQLNAMAQQIQDYTGSLERLVEARTVELASANTQLIEANQQLERLAKTDPLTGLYNRRQFMEQLEFEIRRGTRSPHQFSLIILDVDYFKKYNDTHGHTAGDELLQRMAALLQLNLRGTDVVARYGGEEFVVLLLDTGPEEGFATARKLQQVVEAQPFALEETQPNGSITISVGVAFYPQDSRDGRHLIELADRALYKSKERGRNTVTRWSDMAAEAEVPQA